MKAVLISEDEGQTKAIAASLAPVLPAGTVLLLTGELGTGKSTFVKGLARGLGQQEETRSPTFAIIREYPRLVHVDLYRLTPEESTHLGLEEYFDGGRLVAVEWAERAPDSLWAVATWTLKITFTPLDLNRRRVEIECERPSAQLAAWLEAAGCVS